MADVNVLLTCAGQRVDIVRAFRDGPAAGPHHGRVLVSDLDPLSPALFAADAVVELPPVDDPGYGAAVAAVCRPRGRAGGAAAHRPRPGGAGRRRRPRSGRPARRRSCPTPEVALGCQDKWECHLMLERRGLPSPPTWLPDEVDPGDAALPGAAEAAPGLRRAPHLPLRRPRGARVLPRLQPRRERRAAGPAGPRVQHRLLRRPRRRGRWARCRGR